MNRDERAARWLLWSAVAYLTIRIAQGVLFP